MGAEGVPGDLLDLNAVRSALEGMGTATSRSGYAPMTVQAFVTLHKALFDA